MVIEKCHPRVAFLFGAPGRAHLPRGESPARPFSRGELDEGSAGLHIVDNAALIHLASLRKNSRLK